MEFELYLDDLKPEKQKELLKFYNVETAEEGNYDVIPIVILSDLEGE